MVERSKIHVGLDVHKDSISVAAAESSRRPGRLVSKVTHDVNKLLKLLAKVGSRAIANRVRGRPDGLRTSGC